MIPCWMNHRITVILFFILLLFPFSSIHATEYYAFRLIGSDCTLCHTNPRTGSLNQTGSLFHEKGYRYPLTRKGIFLYCLWGLPLFFIIVGFYCRYRLWCLGNGEMRQGQWKERWKGLFVNGFGHRSILRSRFPGISHLLLFWSLLILGLTTTTILMQEYLFFPLLRIRFIDAETYPYLRLILDLSGMIGWLGTIFLASRRYIQKPKALDHQWTDAISLILLFLIFFTGFSVTGIRDHLYLSPFSSWAPMASALSLVWGIMIQEKNALEIVFTILWWSHLFLSFSLFSYVSFSRLLHLYASPLNIFFRNLEAKGALPKIDLDVSETYGVGKIEEFTWNHLLELDACTRCGRCQETCPAHLSQKALNPKKVIQNLKRHMEISSQRKEGPPLIGGVVTEEEIWDCTTCRNCLEHCPVFIEPMVKLMEFRRNLVLHHGKIPRETHFAFRNIERKGNPWGFDPEKRMWWIKESGVKEVSSGEKVDILFWVGCYGSYDDRNIEVATSLVHILNRSGVDFGVLGSAEWCCGIDLRRMGSEYLFQVNVEKNIDTLQQVKFRKILTTCPHCFNTLKNEYIQFGVQWDVIHYTAFLDELIRRGKVPLQRKEKEAMITYHDSCYLGRYNDGYEPPRRILGAMPDLLLQEMKRSREKGFCCGGGGCHMWMEERTGRRINQMRVEEAQKTGAEILATVCPLCLISLDSAIKVLNLDNRIRVMDILELVRERMQSPHPALSPVETVS
jgi:Fe-S oxidoreductase/nitrate reductase gamma subunit